jgi:hypothetical protein
VRKRSVLKQALLSPNGHEQVKRLIGKEARMALRLLAKNVSDYTVSVEASGEVRLSPNPGVKVRQDRPSQHSALNASLDRGLQAIKDGRVSTLRDMSQYLSDDE